LKKSVTVVLAMLVLAGCGAQSAGAVKEAATAAATTAGTTMASPSATPSPTTPATLTKAQAAKRYLALATQYEESRKDLDAALDASPYSMKDIAAGAKKAAAGYRLKIAGLLDTQWPADVQPYIDKYVELSGLGLNTLEAAAKAKTLSDLSDAGNEEDTRKLNAADTVVRVKLGLPAQS
jgi:hypothetical protein